jgi:hypothetical protein
MMEIKRDFQLNEQQYKRLVDAREGIKRTGGIYSQFEGMNGTATSGVQFSAQVEQSNQNLADINDNFKDSRTQVGELLMAMIVEDITGKPEEVEISGKGVSEDRVIMLNGESINESGEQVLTNDVSRTMLKVVLNDVPSTPSYRTQQLAVMGEAFKSAPPEYQKIMMPFLVHLMDIPNKNEIMEAIKKLDANPMTQEDIEKRVKDEVEAALTKAMINLKTRDLDLKERQIEADAVKVGVETTFAAMQSAQMVATVPQISPIADVIMQVAGYQAPVPVGIDPNLPMPQGIAVPPIDINQNTSPQLPPVTQEPASPMTGIETSRNETL